MRNFKKRTIALILASTLTVAGSFAAEKYKNSVMALDFESGTNGAVTMIVQTKNPYNNSINLVRRDAETYILTLPEFNSSAPTPDLTKTGNILSVTVSSRPYTTSSNGYTRIVIKTNGRASLFAQSRQYIAKHNEPALTDTNHVDEHPASTTDSYENSKVQSYRHNADTRKQDEAVKTVNIYQENTSPQKQTSSTAQNTESVANTQDTYNMNDNTASTVQIPEEEQDNGTNTPVWTFLLIFTAIIFTVYVCITGKNKMADIVGKNMTIDINDDKEEQKKKNAQKPTITHHDKAVVKSKLKENIVKERHTEQVVVEKMNVIDMDELFNVQKNEISQVKTEETENTALEDFLSSYCPDEPEQTTTEEVIAEEDDVYNAVLKNDSLTFSQNDVDTLKQILSSEITEEVLNCPRAKMVTKPAPKPRKPFALENLILEYYIKQSISFSHEDVDIVRKLMDVELDNDFVTDLRTNVKQTPLAAANVNENQNSSVNHGSTTEKLTSVIEEAKEMFTSKSSTEYGATVLKLDFDLPDLQDALAHPEKYEDEHVEEEVDEDSLLKSLSNVQFKPFYTEETPDITTEEVSEPEDSLEVLLADNTSSSSKQEEPLSDAYADKLPLTQTETTSETILNEEPLIIDKTPVQTISNKETQVIDKTPAKTIIIDDTTYAVKSVAKFNENAGCYLAQTDKYYAVLGFISDKIIKLKEYDALKSEKISVRVNETFENGTERYLVKTGLKKFIADFDGSNITYVMDLC